MLTISKALISRSTQPLVKKIKEWLCLKVREQIHRENLLVDQREVIGRPREQLMRLNIKQSAAK